MLLLVSWYRISVVGFIAFMVGFHIHHSRDVACCGTHCTKGVKRTYPAVNSFNGVGSDGFEAVGSDGVVVVSASVGSVGVGSKGVASVVDVV